MFSHFPSIFPVCKCTSNILATEICSYSYFLSLSMSRYLCFPNTRPKNKKICDTVLQAETEKMG